MIMELEELKTAWEDLSKKVEKQDKLTQHIIEKMAQQQYHSHLNKIAYPEFTGTLICYIFALLLAANFGRLDTQLMQLFGILSMAYLLIAPIFSLAALKKLRKIQPAAMTYAETLQDYARKKIRFQKIQKWNVLLAFAFMLVSAPVMLDLMGKNASEVLNFWTMIMPIGTILFFIFALWVLKCYDKSLAQAEKLLHESID